MAHLRSHGSSPYWYLRRKRFDGKWVESSTGYRTDDGAQTQKAKRLAEKATIKERAENAFQGNTNFRAWVPTYLFSRYRLKKASTLRRAEILWSTVNAFLMSESIYFPRQVKYEHAEKYLVWRIGRPVHGKKVGHNTARAELKFLSLLMTEAARREMTESNPFQNMVIPLAQQKRKKALSDDDITKIRKLISNEAPWMRIVFETMLWTGCRFNEAEIEIKNIDFDRNDLTLIDSKRSDNDERRNFTVPLHPELKDLFLPLRNSGSQKTVELTREKNWRFNRFLKSCVGATSHSIRVSFVTRCHQSGLSERQAMTLVNHSSKAIHDIYSRMSGDDVRAAQLMISIPSANGQPV